MITQEDIDDFKESAPSRVPRTSSILEMVRDFTKKMDQPLKNSEGKVLKGPNYQKCKLTDLVKINLGSH